MNRLLMMAIAALVAGMAVPRSGVAQSLGLPTSIVEEVLVKTSLLTFNDANLTGNYTVMHAKLAKQFRERYNAEDLKQAFKAFAGQHIDLIAAKPIVSTNEAKINSNGVLVLRGYFDVPPSRLVYALDFATSEGEWKVINIDVKVRPASTSDAAGTGLLAHVGADLSDSGK